MFININNLRYVGNTLMAKWEYELNRLFDERVK